MGKKCIPKKVCMFIVFSLSSMQASDKQWTWFYKKIFNSNEVQENRKPILMLCKQDLPSFNQLVFSWNALRPKEGFLEFWVQSRDERTKQWSVWHKMVQWGPNVQCSFNSDEGKTKYLHVRLEMGTDYADGFRIKVIAHQGALLANLKALFVSLSHFGKFEAEKVEDTGMQLPSVLVKNVPKKSQMVILHERNKHMCSPTSCSMLVSHLTHTAIDPLSFAEKSFDSGLDAYGSWPFNTAHAFERSAGKIFFATVRMPFFYGLYQQLKKNIPVVVSVRGVLEGAAKEYDKGHLLLVIGFDAKAQTVICHDPAFARDELIVRAYPLKSFLKAWERSHRLAYLAYAELA